ncbi:MAG: hypothetical protein ACRDY3_05625 [Acidimicrobiales bacterium]
MTLVDEAECQRFLATLHHEEAFREAVRREIVIHDLLELPEQVLRITGDGFARVGAESADLRGELADLRADMSVRFDQVADRFTAHEARFDRSTRRSPS